MAVINTLKRLEEEKAYFRLQFRFQSIIRANQGRNANTVMETVTEATNGGMFIGSVLMVCTPCFLIQPRSTAAVGWTLPNQPTIKKMPAP